VIDRRLLQLTAALMAATAWLCPSFVRADDWLAVWPACSIVDASRPSLSLLYPAPGLPAVVHAGDALSARMRTPSALTPPPGVQQERVLERWTAELSGSALHVGVDPKERHRHVLPVVSIRPDGGDSLVYRLRIEIPAYVAPGTYAFALRSPFGTRSAEQAVRVLPKAALPRIVRLPTGVLLPPPAAGSWPADVWLAGAVAEEEAREGELPASALEVTPVAEPARELIASVEAGSDPAPTLLVEGGAVALRVGSELWVRAGCEDLTAFEREVAAVIETEHLTRVAFDAQRAAPSPPVATLSVEPTVAFRVDQIEIDNTGSPVVRELSLLLPFAAPASVDTGTLALFPAIEPNARQPLAKLGRWIVPAGSRGRLRLGPIRSDERKLALQPNSARSGQPAYVRVLGADARAKVAFALGFQRSAYASTELHTSFPGPLAHPVRAQVFEADGAGQVVHGHLWVEPHRPPNCAIAPGGPTSVRSEAALVAFGLVMLVCWRRFAKKARPGTALE
jgi:hypothetical protein